MHHLRGSWGDLRRFRGKDRVTSIRVTGRIRSDNAETILAAAQAGMGIVAPPTFVLAEALRSGALVPLLAMFPMIEQALFAVRPHGPPPAKTRAFIDALSARFGPEPYWDKLAGPESVSPR
jgi:DNA-binding transcriptional LysR family regulator